MIMLHYRQMNGTRTPSTSMQYYSTALHVDPRSLLQLICQVLRRCSVLACNSMVDLVRNRNNRNTLAPIRIALKALQPHTPCRPSTRMSSRACQKPLSIELDLVVGVQCPTMGFPARRQWVVASDVADGSLTYCLC